MQPWHVLTKKVLKIPEDFQLFKVLLFFSFLSNTIKPILKIYSLKILTKILQMAFVQDIQTGMKQLVKVWWKGGFAIFQWEMYPLHWILVAYGWTSLIYTLMLQLCTVLESILSDDIVPVFWEKNKCVPKTIIGLKI